MIRNRGLDTFWRHLTLHRRCERLLRELPIVVPFDIGAFCEAVAAKRGRPILLRPETLHSRPYGCVQVTATADIISYAQNTGLLHQQQIILHEVAHLLWGHFIPNVPLPNPRERASNAILSEIPPFLLDSLQRSGQWTIEEREAELLASRIRQRAAGMQLIQQILEPQLIEALTHLEPFAGGQGPR